MKNKIPIILAAVVAILLLIILLQKGSDNRKIEKEDKVIAENNSKIDSNNVVIEKSVNVDSLLAKCQEQANAEWEVKEKRYEELLKQRDKRVPVARTAPNSDVVAELRELSAYFESDEYKRAINLKRPK